MREAANRHRKLRRQRPGHDLGEGEPELVLLMVDPAALLDQVALHVANQSHWPAEAYGPQLEEIGCQLPERSCAWRGRIGHVLLTHEVCRDARCAGQDTNPIETTIAASLSITIVWDRILTSSHLFLRRDCADCTQSVLLPSENSATVAR